MISFEKVINLMLVINFKSDEIRRHTKFRNWSCTNEHDKFDSIPEKTLLNPLFVVVRGASIIFFVKTCIVAAIVQTLIKFDFFPFGKSMTSYFQLKYN